MHGDSAELREQGDEMNSRKTWIEMPWLKRIAVAAACMLGIILAMPGARAATTWVVSFTIDDSYDVEGNQTNAVRGDLYSPTDPADPSPPQPVPYKDYRSTSVTPDPNFCVEASPYAGGGLFVRLNRKLDGDAGTMRRTDHGGTQRQFSVVISSQGACQELGTNQHLSEDQFDAGSSQWVSPCVMSVAGTRGYGLAISGQGTRDFQSIF